MVGGGSAFGEGIKTSAVTNLPLPMKPDLPERWRGWELYQNYSEHEGGHIVR